MDNNQKLALKILDNAITEPHTLTENSILVDDIEIRIEVAGMNEGNGMFSANIQYYIFSPLLETPFFEVSVGLAGTAEAAIQNSVVTFMTSSYCSWRNLLKGEYEYQLESKLGDRILDWNVAVGCGAVISSVKEMPEIKCWEVIKDKLSSMLPANRLVYIKIYLCKQPSGDVISELRINNIICHDLSNLLKEYMVGLSIGEGFFSNKEIYLFSQTDNSFIPYPHTTQELYNHTYNTLKFFETADLSDDDIVDKLSAEIGDKILAAELYNWLPEACAQNYWNTAQYSDSIDLLIHGREPIKVYKWQLTPYHRVIDAMFELISTGKVNGEVYKKLILQSATAGVMMQILEKNPETNISDLSFSSMLMQFDADYKIR